MNLVGVQRQPTGLSGFLDDQLSSLIVVLEFLGNLGEVLRVHTGVCLLEIGDKGIHAIESGVIRWEFCYNALKFISCKHNMKFYLDIILTVVTLGLLFCDINDLKCKF